MSEVRLKWTKNVNLNAIEMKINVEILDKYLKLPMQSAPIEIISQNC